MVLSVFDNINWAIDMKRNTSYKCGFTRGASETFKFIYTYIYTYIYIYIDIYIYGLWRIYFNCLNFLLKMAWTQVEMFEEDIIYNCEYINFNIVF